MRRAYRVVVLEGGQIVETDHLAELVARDGGRYAQLHTAQRGFDESALRVSAPRV